MIERTHDPAASISTNQSGSLLEVAQRLRVWLAAIVFGCVAVAVTIAFLMRPIYRAEAVLLPVSHEGDMSMLASMASQLGALGSIAGVRMGGDTMNDRSLATLRSRSFTIAFIEEKSLLQRIFEDDWDTNAERWTVDEADTPTLWAAQKVFDEDIRHISENRRTGLVTLAVEWRDRHEAAAWANELVARVNQRIRQQVIEESERSLAYLNKELETTQAVAVRDAIFRLTEDQARKIMLANVRSEYAFQVIDPATPPDDDDYVRPQRAVLIVAGLFMGVGLALVVVLVSSALRIGGRN